MSFSAALGALGGAGLMYIAEVDDRAKYALVWPAAYSVSRWAR